MVKPFEKKLYEYDITLTHHLDRVKGRAGGVAGKGNG
jgi:hypothetical protein